MNISRRTTFLGYLLLIITTFSFTSQLSFAVSPLKRITREEYILRYKEIAIDHQQRYGIPASITMAQGILESDSGNSHLSRGSNNHFGIKCKSNWKGRTFTHTDDAPDECFRAYDKVEHSYEDHAKFLDESPRYDSLFRFSPTDYRSWARGLKGAGYATAPDYTARLVKIIEDNKLFLLDAEAENGTKAYEQMIAAKEPTKPKEEQRATIAVDPDNYQVSISSYKGYAIYKTNRSKYIHAKEGDTYRLVANQFTLSKKSISKYNDTSSPDQTLPKGTIIYIEPKQKKWCGNLREHRVLQGETLHSISQSYAIRESSLRKLNDLKKSDKIAVGSLIKLR